MLCDSVFLKKNSTSTPYKGIFTKRNGISMACVDMFLIKNSSV